jgi:acetyl/propionyl-CoA carboxylase alpha subunit
VYAEDPQNDFLPSVGTLERYQLPEGPGIRVDNGFEEGMTVPIFYDPMLAKLITYGSNRTEAIQRMIEAISQYEVSGVQTTLPFGEFVCRHPAFRTGAFNTHFVKEHYAPEMLSAREEAAAAIAAAMALKQYLEDQRQLRIPRT